MKHLQILCFIAQEHPFDPCLSNDLTETYNWLQNNVEEAQELLVTCKEEPLFLNVDRLDPTLALEWTFVPASRLIFNGPDEGERRRARAYLTRFKRLLLDVGANQVINAARPVLQLSPAEETLNRLRSAFNRQRRNTMFTDVLLISSDNKEFHAHRPVLAAASTHFESLFCGKWSETQGGVQARIPVPELTGSIMEKILGEESELH